MAQLRSLHEKALAVLPALDPKPSTIIVAILRLGKDASGDIEQDDFLWIKCHAKVSLAKIHEQYQLKRGEDVKCMLRHDGEVVDLSNTVATYHRPGRDVIAFEAVHEIRTVPSRKQQIKSDDPLSPRHTNSQLRPSVLSPKITSPIRQDENTDPNLYRASGNVTQSIKRQNSYSSANQPKTTPSYRHMPTESQLLAQQLSPASPRHTRVSPATQGPYVKVEKGYFEAYRSSWIDRYRGYFPGDTEDQLDRRLWSRWLNMPESERNMFKPASSPANIKTEASPEPPSYAKSDSKLTLQTGLSTAAVDQGQKHFQLSAMLKDATPQVLEASVEASVKLLDTLRAPLVDKMANSPDAEHWIQQIDNLQKQAVKTRTVIGVVGNTGAGKSSVINAMLEEERLVPTNCMRACTAVVTEISYNYEEQPYRAEIEFITAEDWAKELKVLFQDLLDGDGNVSRECTNEDSDAGVAYAKIKAVYPQKTKDTISNSSIQDLLNEVSHILGTSRNIAEDDSLMFYKKLQTFVDSKEKSTGKKDKDGKKPKKEREFWPLIRVVRLYVKSPALATGACIVDLPGVHDANAARAAVAEGYMKQCTGLWIVAPINRAVDDKAAKSLLGESFKRQLKMDGGFSAVTFICSKTDDISISEAQDSLGLDEKMVPSWNELDNLSAKQKSLQKELDELKESKDVYEDVVNSIDEEIEVWETLQESVNNGKIAYPPKPKCTKKKRKAKDNESSKRKKKRKTSSGDEDDDDFIDNDSDDADSTDSEEPSDDDSPTQEPLTEDQVNTKLQELKTTKKDARTQKREIAEKTADIRDKLKKVEESMAKINSEMSALCISGRNQYSKGAIQQDFAAGIKEIDQEIAAEEDEENFNPDTEVRDYDEVAKSLPVFCVSSRGYQKLQGRFRKDPPVPGFTTIEQTEIPALQAHCEKLTETGRAANCRAFINKLNSLLNSLTIWASSDGTGANLTAEQKAKEARYLQKGMEGLETRLEKAAKTCAKELNDEFQDNIFDRYEAAVQSATWDSEHTAARWGAPVNRQDRAAGGLYWATYKAICRRNGIFTNSQGLHDWNAQLTEPMIKILAPGWEKVFTRRIQNVMNNFTKSVPTTLKKFHQDIENRARKIGTGLASLSMLSHQISVYDQVLKDSAATTKDMIAARQKDINREFGPVIERAMLQSYEWCSNEVGPGQFKRMKSYMAEHVEQSRHTMFQDSANEVKRQLATLAHDVEETLADKTDEVFIQIKRDYRSVLGGGEVSQGEVLPRVQRQVRREIKRTIDGVERMMKKVVGLEAEDGSDPEEENKDAVSEVESDNEAKAKESDAEIPQSNIKRETPPNHLPKMGAHDGAAFASNDLEADHERSMREKAPEASSALGLENDSSAEDEDDEDERSDNVGKSDGDRDSEDSDVKEESDSA